MLTNIIRKCLTLIIIIIWVTQDKAAQLPMKWTVGINSIIYLYLKQRMNAGPMDLTTVMTLPFLFKLTCDLENKSRLLKLVWINKFNWCNWTIKQLKGHTLTASQNYTKICSLFFFFFFFPRHEPVSMLFPICLKYVPKSQKAFCAYGPDAKQP